MSIKVLTAAFYFIYNYFLDIFNLRLYTVIVIYDCKFHLGGIFMRREVSITEAELEIMQVLWAENVSMTAQELSAALAHKNWKYSTIATLCGRMVEKGTLAYTRRGRFFDYTPTVTQLEYQQLQTRNLVSRLYGGSAKNLVAALFQNEKLSETDIAELKKQFNL